MKPEKHAAIRRDAAAGRAKLSCRKDSAEAFAENATLLMIAIRVARLIRHVKHLRNEYVVHFHKTNWSSQSLHLTNLGPPSSP